MKLTPPNPRRALLLPSVALAIAYCCAACSLTGDDLEPAPFVASGPATETVPGAESVRCDGCDSDDALAPPRVPPSSTAGGQAPVAAEASPTDVPLVLAPSTTELNSSSAVPPGADASVPTEPRGDSLPIDAGLSQDAPLVADADLLGWAAVPGLSLDTTTGGLGGRTVLARTPDELVALAGSDEPLVIQVAGTLVADRVQVNSNKTLLGLGPDATLVGGLRIRGVLDAFVQNVVVRNLTIDAATSGVNGDGVQVHYAHHVWIDHCAIMNAPDGNLDIVHGSDHVTVSWTLFQYEAALDELSRASSIVGHSDDAAAEDVGHLKVTWHHNWWADGVRSNMPQVRFGDVHLFNNYYSSAVGEVAITAATRSRVLVESNVFDGVSVPHRINENDAGPPRLLARGNEYRGESVSFEASGSAFEVPYKYLLDDTALVPAQVTSGAGPH